MTAIKLIATGIVGRHHMPPVGERRDQVAEHVRGGLEAVQEEQGRRAAAAGLAVEDSSPPTFTLRWRTIR